MLVSAITFAAENERKMNDTDRGVVFFGISEKGDRKSEFINRLLTPPNFGSLVKIQFSSMVLLYPVLTHQLIQCIK